MKRQKHNLSNYKLATMDMGQLIPVQLQEVLPGDTMQFSSSALVRVSPMLAPVMHPCTVRFHNWFVPARLLWDKWEDFITGGSDGDNADTIPQYVLGTGGEVNGVLSYLGVPQVENLSVNVLPLRAYNMIFNEFYRDEDLVSERDLDDNTIAKVAWRKDYFTSARPFAQKGSDIYLPLGTSAPIKYNGTSTDQNFGVLNGNNDPKVLKTYSTTGFVRSNDTVQSDVNYQLFADLSSSTGVTATQFREFFALQRYNEARARYGSRYTEYLRYLGVSPSDARMQRPEYLGGGKSTLQFSEVLQTAEGVDPVGNMAGHGITAVKTRGHRRFFEEHGYVITLMSVVPKAIYCNGAPRTFFRLDKEDFFQKELQSIGQQEVLQGEVYALDVAHVRDTFGYSNRYQEYTETPSTIAGEFRTIFDYWHLARKFSSAPVLNESFVECNPSKRIHAVQTNHVLWCMINNTCVARRMVQKQNIGRLL